MNPVYRNNYVSTTTGDKTKVVCPRKCHEGPEREKNYSSTLSLTSALDEDGSLYPLEKDQVPIV